MRTPRSKKNQKKVRRNFVENGVMRPVYPFAGILGQRDMKLALLLNIVDPLIGGVLIMGHRGTGKSTAVRALSELVPQIEVVSGCFYRCDPSNHGSICSDCATKLRLGKKLSKRRQAVKVVELPLGATEDRVCGTINIERALKEGATTFEPGLLANANRGFLYIDEVNLLEDHLVDVLLDVAATGWNRVEREGVSVEHPSRFVLIGSGNPEEGELRPQLIDRFGLHVEVKTEQDLDSRVAVVERREEFDREPEAFRQRFASEQDDLVSAIKNARRNLAKVEITPAVLKKIAQLCATLNVEGHRGELTIMRAARALTALEGHRRVGDNEVKRVAAMSLRHRLRHNVFEDAAADQRILEALERAGESESGASDEVKRKAQPQSRNDKGTFDQSRRNQRAGDDSVELPSDPPAKNVTKLPLKWKPTSRKANSQERTSSGIRQRTVSEQRGRHIRSVTHKTTAGRIALAATLRALMATGTASSLSRSTDGLRYKLFSRKRGTLFIFLIDTSGSMGHHRIALAKRAILDLLRQSYLNRDSVAIITFRGVSASVALPPSRSILRAKRAIESLRVGGSTPLSAGMLCAAQLVRSIKDQHSDKSVLLFTDGRANVMLRDREIGSVERERLIEDELKQLGSAIRQMRAKLIVVDTQRHFERGDDPGRLATLMEAQLIKLDTQLS
ncbi:MAG TPA: magnesium chelatase ATPase subunit I [Pyrinomonadaceae bacterium]